jgi:hypothetical protein
LYVLEMHMSQLSFCVLSFSLFDCSSITAVGVVIVLWYQFCERK